MYSLISKTQLILSLLLFFSLDFIQVCQANNEFDVFKLENFSSQSQCLSTQDLNLDFVGFENSELLVELNISLPYQAQDSFLLTSEYLGQITFTYEDLPLSLLVPPFQGVQFLIQDLQNDECIAEYAFDGFLECISSAGFLIMSPINVTSLQCDPSNGSYYIQLDADYWSQSEDHSFIINGNGNTYGQYQLSDLPIILGPFLPIDHPIDEFDFDFEALGCNHYVGVENNICGFDCNSISNITLDWVEATPQNAFYALDFDSNYSDIDTFLIQLNGTESIVVSVEELPYILELPLLEDNLISIIDPNYFNCTYEEVIPAHTLCDGLGSELWTAFSELQLEYVNCDFTQSTSESTFDVLVDIEFYPPLTNGDFVLYLNGEIYESFDLADFPVLIDSIPQQLPDDILVEIVPEQLDCTLEALIEPFNCTADCDFITDAQISIPSSLPNFESLSLELDFEYDYPPFDSFLIYGAQVDSFTTVYNNLPIQFDYFYETTGVLTIYDLISECSYQVEIPEYFYCSDDNSEPWIISELQVEYNECDPETDEYYLELDFEYVNSEEGFFNLYVLEEYYESYSYSDFPIIVGPFESNSTDSLYLFLEPELGGCDSVLQSVIAPLDCNPCESAEVGYGLECSTNGLYDIFIGFALNTLANSVELFYGQECIGVYDVQTGTTFINLLDFNNYLGENGDLSICYDTGDIECCVPLEIDWIQCEGCAIDEFGLTNISCESNGNYTLVFGYTVENTTEESVLLYYGEDFIDQFPIDGSNQIVLEDFDNYQGDVEWTLCGNEIGSSCCVTTNFDFPPCYFVEIEAEIVECFSPINYTFEITLLDYEIGPDEALEVYLGDESYGWYSPDDFPLTFADIENTTGEPLVITILFEGQPLAVYTLDEDVCTDCEIDEFGLTNISCQANGNYTLVFGYTVENTTEESVLLYYGEDFIDQFPIDGSNQIVLEDFDNYQGDVEWTLCGNEIGSSCCVTTNFDFPPCYFVEIEAEIVECFSPINYTFEITLLDYEIGPDEALEVYLGDESYGWYSPDDFPLTFADIENTTGEPLVITILFEGQPLAVYTLDEDVCTDCIISDIAWDYQGCDEDGAYVLLDFESNNTGNNGFSVVINDESLGSFEYDELPLLLGPIPTEIEIDLVVLDNQNFSQCFDYVNLGVFDDCGEDCEIIAFELDILDCQSPNLFDLVFNYEILNPSGDEVVLYYDEEVIGIYSLDDGEIFLDDFLSDTTNPMSLFTLCVANTSSECCSAIGFENTCETSCGMEPLTFDFLGCITDVDGNNLTVLSLDFEYDGSDMDLFTYTLDGISYAQHYYYDFPIIIEFTDDEDHAITISLTSDPSCSQSVEFDAFFECQDNIWPGDTNDDNICNHFDLLNIGLGNGSFGLDRVDTGIDWEAKLSSDWDQDFPANSSGEPQVNYKHADTDGNGLINELDILAINENYSLTHGIFEAYEYSNDNPVDPVLYIDLPDYITPGVPFEAKLKLGNGLIPLEAFYGVAFTIEYNNFQFESTELEFSPESWLGDTQGSNTNLLTYYKDYPNLGKTEVAIVRNDQENASGAGHLADFIGVIDDILGLQEVEISIKNAKGILSDNSIVPLYAPVEVEVIDLVNNIEELEDDESSIQFYPNPTPGKINITNPLSEDIERISIYDMDGNLVRIVEGTIDRINLEDLKSGIYNIHIQTKKDLYVEPLIKF